MKRPNTQEGCLPFQRPAYIIDPQTGEELNEELVNLAYVMPFLTCVKDKTIETIAADRNRIMKAIAEEPKIKQPTGLAWKHGIRPDLTQQRKNGIMALSRLEKVIQHRIVSELSSYINNPNPKKKLPTHEALKANLGAVDAQMCSITYERELGKVMLLWKCWTRELLFIFDVPDFANSYDIAKYCLPNIRYDKKTKQVRYDFPFIETLDFSKNELHHCYGAYDAGRVVPYVLAFKNRKGTLIAEYKASGRCRAINNKRERILANVKHINEKLVHYDALGLSDDYPKRLVLMEEKKRLRNKAKTLGKALAQVMGWEICRLCKKHGAAVLAAEDLSWVNDAHGSSRWNHSIQQSWVKRECQRVGTAFMTVSAKDSSKECSFCSSQNTSCDSKTRVVTCHNCACSLDRDVSASRVLAKRCCKSYCKYIDKVMLSRIRLRC